MAVLLNSNYYEAPDPIVSVKPVTVVLLAAGQHHMGAATLAEANK